MVITPSLRLRAPGTESRAPSAVGRATSCWIRPALLLSGALGCSSATLSTRYAPLHPANHQAVTFRVIATDSDGIASIRLHVFEYELLVGAAGAQVARRRAAGTWGAVRTWSFPSHPGAIDESHTISGGFPAASYIRYLVEVRDTLSGDVSDSWAFAAGDWPFGNSPIPIWVNGPPGERIDIAFVADRTDFVNARDMLPGLVPLIFDGYHENAGIRAGRKYWQFYYSPNLGFISDFDTPPRQMDIPPSVVSAGIIDGATVIHTTVKRDWAAGGNFGTEPQNRGTAVHESAHAVFGLKDEYAGGGHASSSDPHHNNYDSLGSAQSYNTSNGWAASDAEVIQTSWWRPEPSGLQCIMLDDGDASMPEFGRTCLHRALWFYLQLEP